MKLVKSLITFLIALCLMLTPISAFATELDADAIEETTQETASATKSTQTASSDPLFDITSLAGDLEAPEVDSPATILIEAKSGAILYAKDAYEAYYPASITKIMTALITLEHCSLDEIVTFSYRATHELEDGSSGIARTEGEQMSVRDCLYGLLVASANEVAQALAEHISGSFEAFAELMNEKAAELGCTNTHFSNPSGLNDEQHYTCAHDMALIMRAAIENEDFVKIDSTTNYVIPTTNKHSEELPISMKHELLVGTYKYKYALCGKTGYTSLAGHTLVTYATNGDLDLICVVLHAGSSTERAETSIALFDWGFKNFKRYDINSLSSTKSSDVFSDGSSFLSSNILSLAVPSEGYIVLPNDLEPDTISSRIVYSTGSAANGKIGQIQYLYDGKTIGGVDITVDLDSEDPYEFLSKSTITSEQAQDTDDNLESLKTIVIIVAAVVAVLVVALIAVYRFVNGSSRHHKKRKVKTDRSIRNKF